MPVSRILALALVVVAVLGLIYLRLAEAGL
jgi:hypothetical protein